MKIIGVVSEYNPFHNGHMYHINTSKEAISGDTAVVCVMSGDFVQRGEPAIFPKHVRAEAAVRGGADLVIELPLPWALSSAEGFARGSVGILGALNCIDYLSFGSECGNMDTLNALAYGLMDPQIDIAIKAELDKGLSYAVARQNALTNDLGSMAKYLETPNNILAVEYLKALYNQNLRITPFTVQRDGAGHDEEGGSASDIRNYIREHKSFKHFMPKESYYVFKKELSHAGAVTLDKLELMIISRLRMLYEEDFSKVPDAAEGLGNRIYAAVKDEVTLDGIYSAAKTKRYALSRIRRMCMCAALGLKSGDAAGIPPYARVLAANEKGRKALRIISDKSKIPVITKPADVKNCGAYALKTFELGSRAHDLYVLGYNIHSMRRGGSDWRTSPIMV